MTNGHSFCGLVGNNGIGKSSVLESLDCLLNSKTWNYNVVVKKSGIATTKPHIVPIYLLSSDKISTKNAEIAKKISDYTWHIEDSDIIPQNRVHFKTFREQRDLLKRSYNTEKGLLIPLGLSYDLVPNFSIFETRKVVEIIKKDTDKTNNQLPDEDLKALASLHDELKELFE